MLKINNNFKKYKIPLIAVVTVIGGMFLFQYLTFIPEYSSAESISTTAPVTLPKIEGEITNKFGTTEQGYKTYMQEIDLKYCQSLPVGTTGQLADGRDGKIYWVTVLGDKTTNTNTCWMTQDLDLDLGPKGPILTTANDGVNLYKGSATTWDGGKSVASSDSGWTIVAHDNANWWERNNGAHKAEHNFLGNLYSYEAATAGTSSTVTSDGGEVPGSICPAGWKLPLGDSSTATGAFNGLGLTSSNVTGSPYYFQMGGYIVGSLSAVGSYGGYWSATSVNIYDAYSLLFDNGGVNPANDSGRSCGFSVRCVVRDASYTAPVMLPDSAINNPNVSVSVPNVITLDVYSNEEDKENKVVDIETNSSDIGTGTFIAEVSANANYNILLNAASEADNATSLIGKKEDGTLNNHFIPTMTTEQPQAGVSSWGIRVCTGLLEESCNAALYRPLPTYNNSGDTATFYNGTPAFSAKTMFQIGIGVASDLPSGTYSTNILVTASQK